MGGGVGVGVGVGGWTPGGWREPRRLQVFKPGSAEPTL